ncbi:hypothetical protein TSUD_279650 [Trifolium subterraneum]|uniref:Uncharacterized protein n=1 Tax=Trifolium subterraneum TaxID=3900 RepID=A0A2Z6NAM6_TRISU|nr:hypothetical protein TSUD_279650 [Trifolium subterraneum]
MDLNLPYKLFSSCLNDQKIEYEYFLLNDMSQHYVLHLCTIHKWRTVNNINLFLKDNIDLLGIYFIIVM